MLQHEGNTQGVCPSILEIMPRHWNIYEKTMSQHAIANVAACVEGRLLVVKIRKMDAATSMVQCRTYGAYASWMPRHSRQHAKAS